MHGSSMRNSCAGLSCLHRLCTGGTMSSCSACCANVFVSLHSQSKADEMRPTNCEEGLSIALVNACLAALKWHWCIYLFLHKQSHQCHHPSYTSANCRDGPSAQTYVVLVLTALESCVKLALSKMPDRAAYGLMCQPF